MGWGARMTISKNTWEMLYRFVQFDSTKRSVCGTCLHRLAGGVCSLATDSIGEDFLVEPEDYCHEGFSEIGKNV